MHRVPLVLFFILTLFPSCNDRIKTTKAPTTDQLKLSFFCEPLTIDPRKQADPVSCNLIFMLYEGLTKLEPDGSISLCLASSVEISKNRLKYIFHLKDAKWSSGKKITAYDFAYSWKKILDPKFNTPNAYFLYPIRHAKEAKKGIVPLSRVGVYAIDDNTLIVKLENGTPHFLEMLAFCTYFPVPEHIDEESPNWGSQSISECVSSGPFTLDCWKNNQMITLKRNHYYWNKELVRLEEIQISIIPDPMTSFKLFEMNEIHWMGSFYAPIPLDALNSLVKERKFLKNIIEKPQAGTTCQFFNTQCFPLNNMNIRKAFAYAINKKNIVEINTEEKNLPAFRLIPPSLSFTSNDALIEEGSAKLAREYLLKGLEELHLKIEDFPRLTLNYFPNQTDARIAQVLQQQFKTVLRLEIDLECLDIKVFLDKLKRKNFHFALGSIIAQYYDSMNFFERFLYADEPKNFCSWENPRFAELIERSNEIFVKKERHKILEQAEKIFLDEMPLAPIHFHSKLYLKHPKLKGVDINPIGVTLFTTSYFDYEDVD